MGIKLLEFVDVNGNKVVLNPASVHSICEMTPYVPDGKETKDVNINTMSYCFSVDRPIEEVRQLIWPK